ncbi:WD repeat-containing protein 61 isoform X2 [Trichoplusia ni]|uniref:WD repeat-containing protein 61 isoform X2 n=1 Tax=Trichoplusia ni TaxID=7111 RepID=A0A7E5WLY9_TRINI|nr:WD repeat-containing protein 61 isoform X2 [Trichoplusia ni]
MEMPANTIYSLITKKENAHEDPIYCCAWARINTVGDSINAAKDFIVTGGLDCLVKVWVLGNNKLELVHTLEGHSMAVVSVAVSPTAPIIVSSSLDSSLIFWDLTSGRKMVEIPTGTTDVWKVAFSPNGEKIATGGHTGKVHIYEIQNGDIDKMLDTRGKFILSVAWSRNGRYIATGADNGVVCILDVMQGKLVHSFEAHTQSVRSVDFSPCNTKLATASNDGFVKVYDVASAGLQFSLDHKCWALGVCFTAEGTRVATAAADGSVRVAAVDKLAVLATFEEHTDIVWGVSFCSTSKKLVSVSKDKSINIYECPPMPVKVEKEKYIKV